MIMSSPLADALDEATPRLIAGVEATMSPSTLALPLRRTIERLPGLMRDLIGYLRADRLDEPGARASLPIRFDVVPLVTALRVLRESIFALFDAQQLSITPRDVRIISGWFAAVAESALLAENGRFAEMLDALPDHMLLYDGDGYAVNYVNRAVYEGAVNMTTMSREAFLGRRIVEIVDDKNFGLYVEDCLRRVAGGESITDEFIYPAPNGGRWHEQHMRPVYGLDGRVDSIAITSRDIHDRKKAEGRLQLLSKLSALAESMEDETIVDAMAHLSIPELADWCLINVVDTGQFQRMTIAHRDPSKATIAHELLHRPSQLHHLHVGAAALAGTPTLIAEIDHAPDLVDTEIVRRLEVRSALVVPIAVMGDVVAIATFMMTSESGRRYGADDLELAQEMARRAEQIIENAKLHQQLKQSEARFRFALDHASISVFETDADLRFRWSHNSMPGLDGNQVISPTLGDVVSREVEDQVPRRVIETGESAHRAFSVIVDGKRRHFMVRYEPLRGADGIVGLSGAAIDVTELKEAEEQLAQELAFRERMMGILGHDLRNPVSAILGITSLMLGGNISDKARTQLGFIEQATRRMNEMIGTLFDFTRLRFHGSLPISLARIGLDELAREVVAELRAAHRGREIELAISGNLRGEWDPGRMAQLFTNLTANALTHGDKSSPVWISVAGDEGDVVLSVSNRGASISTSLAERLFEPFKQGGDGDGSSRRGLGLGLFIVREIVRAHGGKVGVHSDDGLVTFTATLPRGVVASPSAS